MRNEARTHGVQFGHFLLKYVSTDVSLETENKARFTCKIGSVMTSNSKFLIRLKINNL